jgi:predicted ABC-type ATPase
MHLRSSWQRPLWPLHASVADRPQTPRIYVLAGVNGAGKTSVGGAMFDQAGVEFFNPDSAARKFLSIQLGMSQEEANSAAWQEGRRLLERAIDERQDFAFETTLGGNTMASLLEKAISRGIEVRIWYVGLESADLHIARVRSRVAMGGHGIPEAKVRERYSRSRMKLIELLPNLTQVKVFDNTEEGDPQKGQVPSPKILLHVNQGEIVSAYDLRLMPQWAKPILQAAIESSGTGNKSV